MMKKRYNDLKVLLLGLVIMLAASCKKDKVQVPQEPEPTKYELISGNYKVYDTSGVFLYDMNLFYLDGPIIGGFKRDSIYFTNFDGEFDFVSYQGNPSNPELFVGIGNKDTLTDSNSNRWKILSTGDPVYDKIYKEDTIRLIFHKTNINYWIEDAVPFEECYCKQIAVKQH
ncbi:MAG: hypothetical protein Crog4KO_33420 [Crocinitomicaceae bacterium]